VVEASTPGLVDPLVDELLDGLEEAGEAELMAEYFEPVSVRGLGRVLGLGHLDGDTLRRWFHGLAEGAINFEDDPAKWEIADATAAEIDDELAPSSSGSTRIRTIDDRRCSRSRRERSRSGSRRFSRRSR
jgi:cytochrome P450